MFCSSYFYRETYLYESAIANCCQPPLHPRMRVQWIKYLWRYPFSACRGAHTGSCQHKHTRSVQRLCFKTPRSPLSRSGPYKKHNQSAALTKWMEINTLLTQCLHSIFKISWICGLPFTSKYSKELNINNKSLSLPKHTNVGLQLQVAQDTGGFTPPPPGSCPFL